MLLIGSLNRLSTVKMPDLPRSEQPMSFFIKGSGQVDRSTGVVKEPAKLANKVGARKIASCLNTVSQILR